MTSLFPGYEYDIFISYRQNDNKYDGWVTEFVTNLTRELEATIKGKVTVYFDANPHDGLLETHSVDRSLEDKLRCLIFIPILSRTYCDTNSYAWNNEFLTFLKIAREDRTGLNIKLSNSNVATRVLPVRIHDLNPEDVSLVKSQIGEIRSIDFIYKSPGVNRPLRANEDHPQDNLNKTYYRDQINKVANAVDEIISSLKMAQTASEGGKSKHDQSAVKDEKEEKKRESGEDNRAKSNRWLIISLVMLLCIIGVFAIIKIISSRKQAENLSKQDKSIAVLPFVNDSPDKENEYLCNGMMEEILNQLQKISDLRVKDRASVEKYRNPNKDIKVIGQELRVSLIMEGSVRKMGDDLRINVQLIDTKTGDHLWSEIYSGKYTTKILEFQSNIAKKVASSLNAVITPQEEKRIEVKPPSEILAYDLSSRGQEMIRKWNSTNDSLYLRLALNLFNKAQKIDPNYIVAITGKGQTYALAGKYDSAMVMYDIVQELDPTGFESAYGKGDIYFYSNKPDSAFKYRKICLDLAPNDLWTNIGMGQLYFFFMNDVSKGLSYFQKAYNHGGDNQLYIPWHIAILYYYIGNYAKALKYIDKEILLQPECNNFITYSYILSAQGKYKEAFQYLDSICSISDCEQKCDIMKFHIYTELKEFKKAEEYYNRAVKEGYKPNEDDDLFIALLYNETGRKKEAVYILTDFIKRNENLLNSRGTASNFGITGFRLSAAYAMIGEKKKALKYITTFNATVELLIQINPGSFPGFDSLRSDPEFMAFFQRIEDEKSTGLAQVRDMEQRGEINL